MSQQPDNFQFPSDIDYDRLHTEQPLDPQINRSMQMPNPLDPIGNIATEGRALRNLSSGRMPLWVLLCGWATIGLFSFLFLGMGLQLLLESARTAISQNQPMIFLTDSLALLPMVIIAGLLLMILFRATWRKRG